LTSNCQSGFEDVKDRLPVDARRFDGDVRAAFRNEPVGEAQQVVGHGREGARLTLTLFDEAGDGGLGVNVDAAATRIQDLHLTPPSADG
jgi:hypothetical protein